MQTYGKIALIVFIACAAAAMYWWHSAGSATSEMRLTPGDAEVVSLGEAIYAGHCAACHGVNLEGQPNWQVRGADGLLPAPPHDETGHTWHHPDRDLILMTKIGIGAMIGDPDYPSAMPAYEEILSDAEIVAALSYIKSRWSAEIQARHDLLNGQSED